MTDNAESRVPPPELVEQALSFPGGWVYEIDGEFAATEAIPPERIRGGWEVDQVGRLTGRFERNPNFLPLRD